MQSISDFQQHLRALSAQLEKTAADPGGVEQQALRHLRSLLQAIEAPVDRRQMDRQIQSLHQFWMQSVDWCSQLSKQLERVLVDYGELNLSLVVKH
jgi:hypothetical protein